MASVSAETPASHGHSFSKKTFHKPTYCHSCTDMLWGLIQQGYICEGKIPRPSPACLAFPPRYRARQLDGAIYDLSSREGRTGGGGEEGDEGEYSRTPRSPRRGGCAAARERHSRAFDSASPRLPFTLPRRSVTSPRVRPPVDWS